MSDFEKNVTDELTRLLETDREMLLLVKITEFANWLEEGVEKTKDPMVIKVHENYMNLFGEYLQKVEESNE